MPWYMWSLSAFGLFIAVAEIQARWRKRRRERERWENLKHLSQYDVNE